MLKKLLNILMFKHKVYIYELEVLWLHGETQTLTKRSLYEIHATEKVEILLEFNLLLALSHEAVEIKSFKLIKEVWV